MGFSGGFLGTGKDEWRGDVEVKGSIMTFGPS